MFKKTHITNYLTVYNYKMYYWKWTKKKYKWKRKIFKMFYRKKWIEIKFIICCFQYLYDCYYYCTCISHQGRAWQQYWARTSYICKTSIKNKINCFCFYIFFSISLRLFVSQLFFPFFPLYTQHIYYLWPMLLFIVFKFFF